MPVRRWCVGPGAATANALAPARRPRRVRNRSTIPRGLALLAVAALAAWARPTPARAQLGLSATAASDYRIRGFSLSGGKPAFTLDAAYDGPGGAYAGGSLIFTQTRHGGVGVLGSVVNAGYVARLGDGDTAIDLGGAEAVLNTNTYHSYVVSYGELYAGVSHKGLAAYVYYSPDYLNERFASLYTDLSASVRVRQRWRVFGHLGLLTPIGGRERPENQREQFDLRAGAAYAFSRAEVQLAFTTASPYASYPAAKLQARDALVVQATYFF